MLASAVEHLVKGIVDHPDDVQVGSANRRVARSSRCACIPRTSAGDRSSGRTAKALRTLVTAFADGRRVRVDVVDTDEA